LFIGFSLGSIGTSFESKERRLLVGSCGHFEAKQTKIRWRRKRGLGMHRKHQSRGGLVVVFVVVFEGEELAVM
jgi:hypothetical protein